MKMMMARIANPTDSAGKIPTGSAGEISIREAGDVSGRFHAIGRPEKAKPASTNPKPATTGHLAGSRWIKVDKA